MDEITMQDNTQTNLAPDPIHFTDAAVAKVKSLIEEEGNDNLKLRDIRARRRLRRFPVWLSIR